MRTSTRTVAAGAGLVALFAAGCVVAYAVAGGAVRYVPLVTGPKPGKAALAAAKTHCVTLRHRVGVASFTKTFKTLTGCRNILGPTAQSGMTACRKRYPVGSTAYSICLQIAFENSPAEKAAVAGLRIVTDRTVTYIPIPGSGHGAGTGGGTGAGTGGGPGHH